MMERENNVIKNELEQRVSDENIDVIVNYINNTFDNSLNSSVQLSNMVKLSNFLNKNSFLVEELEAEKLLSKSDKLVETLKALYNAGILVRINNYSNLINSFSIS